MKTKNLWVGVGLSLLLVAVTAPSLLLTSCTKKTTSTTTTMTTTTAVTTAANTPVLGGTLTMLNDVGNQNQSDWDMALTNTGGVTEIYDNPYLETYFCGDIDTYGPRGNNEDLFQSPEYIPSQYLGPNIGQSWSFQENPLSLTITIKQGIMWTGNSNIGMAARELTATDCAFEGTRIITSPAMAPYFTWIKDCVVVDQYTFRWDFSSYQADWQFFFLYAGNTAEPFAPESANASSNGGHNWKNQVGTGPFELSNFVDGISVTYTKNPIYWGTTTINGKQYSEPLIDTLVYLIIPDPSTQLAAIETGKIDLCSWVPYSDASTLTQQAPKLIQEKWLSDNVDILRMSRLASGDPLSNLQVRQALCEATDYNSIANNVYGGGDIFGWPVAQGNPSYTPLSQQSAVVQALFSFNPTAAKQMLTAAGYPKGFTTSISVDSSIIEETNEAQILASDWAQVGVTLQIKQLNTTALASEKNDPSYVGIVDYPVPVATALMPLQWYQASTLAAVYAAGDPLSVEANAALQEEDPLQQEADVTQFCKDAVLDCGILGMTNPYTLNCYQPWLENYYGEVDAGYQYQIPMIRELWINQTLKTQDGY